MGNRIWRIVIISIAVSSVFIGELLSEFLLPLFFAPALHVLGVGISVVILIKLIKKDVERKGNVDNYMLIGMIFGMSFGLLLGLFAEMLFSVNIFVGSGIGMLIGMCIGICIKSNKPQATE